MKKLLFFILTCLCVVFGYSQTENWSSAIRNRAFVENIGQFSSDIKNRSILYSAEFGNGYAHFTPESVIIVQYTREDNPREEEHKTKKDRDKLIKEELKELEWDRHEHVIEFLNNTGQQKILPSRQTDGDFLFNNVPDERAKGYKKLTYTNIYPNIDLVFRLIGDKGVKYAFVVHPGGDPNDIQLKHKGAELEYDEKWNLIISTKNFTLTDEAPISYLLESGKSIESSSSIKENIVGFGTDQYPPNETLVIDPWLNSPLPTLDNIALKVDYDYAGNVIVHGGGSPLFGSKISKFDPNGTLLWTWNFANAVNYGDMSCNRQTGDVFITNGLVGGINDIVRLTTNGTVAAQFTGATQVLELWRCAFDQCGNQLIIGSGGPMIPAPSSRIAPDLINLISVNSLGAGMGEWQDVVLLDVDPWDTCAYFLVAENGGQYGNFLYKATLPDFATTSYQVASGHNFFEIGSITFHGMANGFNGMAVDREYLYTFDGNNIKQWDKTNGTLINQTNLGLSEFRQSGIDTDACGNLYVSAANEIRVFDDAFTLLNTIALPDTCYDVRVGSDNHFYACGKDFVQAFDLPTVSIIQAVGDSCTGDFTITGCPNLDSMDVDWSPSGLTGTTVTGLTPGWHTYTLTGGCAIEIVDSVFVAVACDITVNMVDDTICQGECVDIIASTTGAYVDPVTYQWNNGLPDTDSTVTVCPLVTTTYTVIATDDLGDADTTSVTITILTPPVADLGNDTVICSPPYVLDAGNPGSTYTWSDNSTNQTLSVNNTGTYWVIIDNGGCTDSTGVDVTVVDVNVDLGPDTTLCNSVSLQLDAGNPGATYLWNDNSTNQTLNVTVAGTYWAEATINGCSHRDTIVINVIPSPIVNLGNDTTLCPGDTLLLDAQNVGSTYLWHDASTNQTFEVTTAGTYWVEASIGNCSDTDSIAVNYDPITVDLGPDITTCRPDTIVLDAGNPGANYLWNDNSTNQTLNVATIGQYFVEVTNGTGCQNSDTININAGSITATLPNDTTLCGNQSLMLDAGNPGGAFLWNDNSTNQALSVSNTGTYWVEVTSGICSASDTIDVFVQDILASFVASDTAGCVPLTIDFTDQSSVNPGIIASWQWNFGDGGASDQQNPQHTYQNAGVYDVQLTIESDIGCTDDTTVTAYIHGYPFANAALIHSPTQVLIEETVSFQNQSTNSTNWQWDFGDGITSTDQHPTHIYEDVGNYIVTLIAINENGCHDTTTYLLVVGSEILLFAPNAFTPDDDSHNPVWQYHISGINSDKFSVEIFNRWGELIWTSHTPNEPWDGFYNGTIVQDGIYTWKLECGAELNDERKVFTGHINVLR